MRLTSTVSYVFSPLFFFFHEWYFDLQLCAHTVLKTTGLLHAGSARRRERISHVVILSPFLITLRTASSVRVTN